MKNVFQLLAIGLAVNTASAANCRPSPPVSAVSSVSSVSSIYSASSVSASSSTSASSSASSASSISSPSPSPSVVAPVCEPGSNRVLNGDFTAGSTDWSTPSSVAQVQFLAGTCSAPSGSCVRYITSGPSASVQQDIATSDIGSTYAISFVYATSSTTPFTAECKIVADNGLNTVVADYVYLANGMSGGWKTYSNTFVAQTATSQLVFSVTGTAILGVSGINVVKVCP